MTWVGQDHSGNYVKNILKEGCVQGRSWESSEEAAA